MTPRHCHDELLYKRFVLVYEQYTKLITAHESITTNPKYMSILCIYPHFHRGFDFDFFSNRTLEISIEIPFKTSNMI